MSLCSRPAAEWWLKRLEKISTFVVTLSRKVSQKIVREKLW